MFKRILVPVDLTAKNHRALDIAAECAGAEHGQVTLLHVIERINHLPFAKLRRFYETLERSARRKMARMANRLARAGVDVRLVILRGNRAADIVTHAIVTGVDLIVVSSHAPTSRTAVENWGTISYKVALLAPCPVLLVK